MNHFRFLCLGVALLAACNKPDDIVVCGPTAPATFADLRAAAPAVQLFTFNLGQAQSIRTAAGATIAFSANAFILPNGTMAAGQAQLRVREVYSVPDMIFTNMPTTAETSRQMLVSGGEFNIQVWQGSSRLRLGTAVSPASSAQPFTLTSPVPTAGLDTTQMLLWKQPASSPATAGTLADSSGWQLLYSASQTTTAINPTRVPTVSGYYKASLPLDSISNWNIDQFWHIYQTAPRGNVVVDVPTGASATATRVYFRPSGFNGLARGYGLSTGRWYAYLPYGADMTAVVLQERDGQLYYGTQRVTTAAGLVVSPPLQALSAAEIVQRIRQL